MAIWLNLRYDVQMSFWRRESNEEGRDWESDRDEATGSEGPRAMVSTKKRRRGRGTDTEQGEVKALREKVEELRDEVQELKLSNAKVEAGCQTPQEDEKEVRLPTEVWAKIAGKLDPNDVCSFALVSKQLREAQVLAGRKLVTRPYYFGVDGYSIAYFTEDWCAYWSKTLNVFHTDPGVIREVLYIPARHGYLQVFEKYWSQGPQEKLSKLWDKETCGWAAQSGQLEVIKWLRAKRCPWESTASENAALCGDLEMLQWMRAQDPPCPWDSDVCNFAAYKGHLEVLRWARSQGCPWDKKVPCAAALRGHLEVLRWARSQDCPWDEGVTNAAAGGGHLEVLQWMRAQDPPCPWDSGVCWNAAEGGHLEVLRWARSQGCPWNERVTNAAAGGGHLKVLKWLEFITTNGLNGHDKTKRAYTNTRVRNSATS
ncbi:putative ankyrin repeat protein [Chloropicon roscoffensis]|uniref:Ankyrin repeat protein n=1 Tax=Chloropicon roscoffensis TaxID=1461544 RepID=A0AAX4PI54_9CHLO